MNARELLDDLESGLIDEFMSAEVKAIYIRALRLLAAAESNDGTVCKLVEDLRTEADLCRNETATDIAELLDDAASSIIAISAQFNAIKDERNGLAARVVELTPDAERYRWLRKPQDHICVDVEEENEDGWTGTFYALVRDELDAAVDAARSKP